MRISPIVERAPHMFYLAAPRRLDGRLFVLQPAACSGVADAWPHLPTANGQWHASQVCQPLPRFLNTSHRCYYRPPKLPPRGGYLRFFLISRKKNVFFNSFYSLLKRDFSDTASCLGPRPEERAQGGLYMNPLLSVMSVGSN